MKKLNTSLLCLCAAMLTNLSFGQNFNPTAPAHGFNAYTKSALTLTGSDTHGPVATGGDLILAGETSVAQNDYGKYPNVSGGTSNYGLVAGGRVYYNSGNQSQAHGQIKIGNTTGSNVNYINCSGTNCHVNLTSSSCTSCNPSVYSNDAQPNTSTDNATTSTGLNFATDFSSLYTYNTYINTYTALSASQLAAANLHLVTIPSGSGTVTIPITAGTSSTNPSINIINITSTNNFNTSANYQFSTAPTSSTIVLINIAFSGTYAWVQPNVSGNWATTTAARHIIWNFFSTSSYSKITMSNSNTIWGTVFAPGSTILKTGNSIEGQVVADSLSIISGEIHYDVFEGQIPTPPTPSTGTVTPIEFITLRSNNVNTGAQLSWDFSMHNTDLIAFSVQRSEDGLNFNDVTMLAMPKHDAVSHGTWTDNSFSGATAYYRLRASEVDGHTSFSNIAVARNNAITNISVNASPNPFTDKLTINISGTITYSWKLLNTTGTIVKTGSNNAAIDNLSKFPAGMYILQVTSQDGTMQRLRLIKQ